MDTRNVVGIDGSTLGANPVHSDTPVRADAKDAAAEAVRIHHGGREFVATSGMAGVFLRRAQQIIDEGDAQLVPLLHRNGLDLLLISAAIPLAVHDARLEPGATSLRGRQSTPLVFPTVTAATQCA
jgi:hypothetical protein